MTLYRPSKNNSLTGTPSYNVYLAIVSTVPSIRLRVWDTTCFPTVYGRNCCLHNELHCFFIVVNLYHTEFWYTDPGRRTLSGKFSWNKGTETYRTYLIRILTLTNKADALLSQSFSRQCAVSASSSSSMHRLRCTVFLMSRSTAHRSLHTWDNRPRRRRVTDPHVHYWPMERHCLASTVRIKSRCGKFLIKWTAHLFRHLTGAIARRTARLVPAHRLGLFQKLSGGGVQHFFVLWGEGVLLTVSEGWGVGGE